MTNSIPIVDVHSRSLSLRYSVKGSSICFFLTRFDGHSFNPPSFATDALNSELENKFVEIVELFEGY